MSFCRSARVGFAAFLATLGFGVVSAAPSFDPYIMANHELKQRLNRKSGEERAEAYRQYGLRLQNADVEVVALYVDEPLTEREVKSYSLRGIEVDAGNYVPPVPGDHPRGFYLASVRHGALGLLRQEDRFVAVSSVEHPMYTEANSARAVTKADLVHAGSTELPEYTGAGVKLAVADSTFDLGHADLPTAIEAYNVTTGSTVESWAPAGAALDMHGTHVAGSALGRGTLSGGNYKGTAPDADFLAYQISATASGSSNTNEIIKAVNRASSQDARVFNLSFGGWGTYNDGSESVAQAIDSAHNNGMLSFVSAGNSRTRRQHFSTSVAPLASSPTFTYTTTNSSTTTAYTGTTSFIINWRDGVPLDYNVQFSSSSLGAGESLTGEANLVGTNLGTSTRGTEVRIVTLTHNVPPSSSKTYTLTLNNAALSGESPLVHIYVNSGANSYNFSSVDADQSYTVSSPATADKAIAVGASVHRGSWTNFQGNSYGFGEVLNNTASFSSIGPRIDGVQKPEIVAPGSAMISLRAAGVAASSSLIIDDDGTNNGAGPANYYVLQGTSMASPHAAGIGALLVQAAPLATAEELRQVILATASQAASPDFIQGYGMIDALAAVEALLPTVTVEGSTGQDDPVETPQVNFDVVFSETVSGFTEADLVVGGTAGATSAIISGTGPSYTVSVSGMTESGTVTLSVPKGGVTSASKGALNKASTSGANTINWMLSSSVDDWLMLAE